jgi:hypothetical protein
VTSSWISLIATGTSPEDQEVMTDCEEDGNFHTLQARVHVLMKINRLRLIRIISNIIFKDVTAVCRWPSSM